MWANLAARYLRAVASREALAEGIAVELAEAVLESPLFRLALDVIDGEEHQHGKATELASSVLEACGMPTSVDGGTDPRGQVVGAGSAGAAGADSGERRS